jgi:dihydropteroate synthase
VVEVAAGYGAGLVCSHTGGAQPRTNPRRVAYLDVVADVIAVTTSAAERAAAAGVPREGILIDPTHDFGKNTWHGLELVRRTGELVETGWPVLMALSRKDFVGETLDAGVDDRLPGTLAATALAAAAGAAVFRAHDVRATRQVLEMVASIQGRRAPVALRRGLV